MSLGPVSPATSRATPPSAPVPAPREPVSAGVRPNSGARPHDINIIVTVRTEPAEKSAPAKTAEGSSSPSLVMKAMRVALQGVGGLAATAGVLAGTAGVYAWSLGGKVVPLLGHVSAATGEASALAIGGLVAAVFGGAVAALARNIGK